MPTRTMPLSQALHDRFRPVARAATGHGDAFPIIGIEHQADIENQRTVRPGRRPIPAANLSNNLGPPHQPRSIDLTNAFVGQD